MMMTFSAFVTKIFDLLTTTSILFCCPKELKIIFLFILDVCHILLLSLQIVFASMCVCQMMSNVNKM